LQVLLPNKEYNGHVPVKAVTTSSAATISKTMPVMPLTVWEKNSAMITAASISLMILSVGPIFVFILFYCFHGSNMHPAAHTILAGLKREYS
jgi:hypothetical protein